MKCCFDRRLIGEVFLEKGLVTPVQLQEALRLQASRSERTFLGELLEELGYVSEIDIVTALVLQCNLPYIAINKHEISSDIIRLIPAEVALRDRLVPLDRIGNILSVVMRNPMDSAARAEVESLTGCTIAIFISTRSEIDQALTRLYGRTV